MGTIRLLQISDLHFGDAESGRLEEQYGAAMPQLVTDIRNEDVRVTQTASPDSLADSFIAAFAGGVGRLPEDRDARAFVRSQVGRHARRWGVAQGELRRILTACDALLVHTMMLPKNWVRG